MQRIAIIGSPEKASVGAMLERVRRWVGARGQIVFSEITYDSAKAIPSRPDVLFVLGGDGTMLAAVHNLGPHQIPIVGLNLGKVGYLADFTVEDLETQGEFLFAGPLPISRRVMLSVQHVSPGAVAFETLAVNDCVVLAGPPFRMIELVVEADAEEVASMRGDGLIVATASGSTAHNLSAGGPILEPTSRAFVLTPICPHALTFRPLAVNADRRIGVRVLRANEGTTMVVDGHTRRALRAGDMLVIARYGADFLLVRNPQRSLWYALRKKLMWGQNPTNGA